jgi:hypothetical protein
MKNICPFSPRYFLIGVLVTWAFVSIGVGKACAQAETAWGYSTGYGNVYGSYGLAQTMQTMYNVARAKAQKITATEASGRVAGANSTSRPRPQQSVQPRLVSKNYGKFVPDPKLDTGKAFADALGDTAEERQLINKVYSATKTAFEKEAAVRGWQNNMAGGLTFFTTTAVTIYNDSEEPSDQAVQSYYEVMNAAFDEIPEFKNVSNRDKQNFNNMTVGFAGLLLAGYLEGKQTGNADTVASYRKLAGVLLQMVLKTDPENIKIENGQIVMK